MGLKVVMEQTVGDGIEAVKAEGTITCEADNWANDLYIHVVVPNDTDTPDEYHKDDFTDPAGDDIALATELKAFLDTIGTLEVTQANEVLTVKAKTAGRAGNDISFGTNYGTAFVVVGMANGRDRDGAVDMIMTLDEDTDELTMKVGETIVLRTIYKGDSYDNEESFARNFHEWFKKAQSLNIHKT